jgi:hypothetical protein
MEKQMKKVIMGALMFGVLTTTTSAFAAPAANKGAFCGSWGKVCLRICTEDATSCANKCAQRKNACIASGCFNLWTRDRCFSNPQDVALTDPKFSPQNRGKNMEEFNRLMGR